RLPGEQTGYYSPPDIAPRNRPRNRRESTSIGRQFTGPRRSAALRGRGAMAQNVIRIPERDSMDKNKALDAALQQIERAFGKGSITRLGGKEQLVETEVISTGSLGLDIGLGIGGLPRGRIVEIYGPESSGKTTLALQVIAEAQKTGGACAFVDAEHALDP